MKVSVVESPSHTEHKAPLTAHPVQNPDLLCSIHSPQEAVSLRRISSYGSSIDVVHSDY